MLDMSSKFLKESTDRSDDSITLDQFLARPRKINTYSWSPQSFLSVFNPWSLFLKDARVSNRIANYANISGTLCLKFVINGNPFYYGRIMASYQPYAQVDEFTANTFIEQDSIQMSQMPRIFLDPTTSMGGVMKLPFFWHKDFLSLTRLDGALDDTEVIGSMVFRVLNKLKHVSGTLEPTVAVVSITTYAWMEDVKFCGLTRNNPIGISPQAGELSSAMYSSSKIAGALTTVPSIAPYADIAQRGLQGLGRIAEALGYSRHLVKMEPQQMWNVGHPTMASTNVPDNAVPLAVDSHNTLSVDPSISGVGNEDQMSIAYIAQKESYLTKFVWQVDDALEALLFSIQVTPSVREEFTVGGQRTLFLPACAHASTPFSFWKGKMKYRFEIVASAMHKGRLMIVYDADSITNTYKENTSFNRMIDISEEREFTFEVDVNQSTTWLNTSSLSSSWVPFFQSGPGSVPIPSNPGFINGVIGVYVVNRLTTPNTSAAVDNDIEINVYVSAGDNFEVAFMRSTVPGAGMKSAVMRPQAGELAPTTDVEAPDHDEQVTDMIGVSPQRSSPQLYDVYMGEKVISFRQLLQRPTLVHAVPVSPINSGGSPVVWTKWQFPVFPYYRGNIPGAVNERAGPFPYNYTVPHLLNWLAPAYTGMRGSIRTTVVPDRMVEGSPSGKVSRLQIECRSRPKSEYTSFTVTNGTVNGGNAIPKEIAGLYEEQYSGMAAAINNAPLSVSSPMYSKFKFAVTKRINPASDNQFNALGSVLVWATASWPGTAAIPILHRYTAAGDDFTFMFYTGMPRVYIEDSYPSV